MLRSAKPTSTEVINLCFHGLGEPGRALEADEEQYWLDVAQFQEFLNVISRYPSIRITFDDGNASDAGHALPALVGYGLTASFFVVAGRLNRPGSLTSSDIHDLVRAGMTVGSHGMVHRPWRSLDDQELRSELADATQVISDVAGHPISEVACPFGSYDRRVLRAIRRHGFRRVYTVDGPAARSDAWLQSRYTLRRDHTPADLERIARAPRGSAFGSALRMSKTLAKRLR